MNDIVRGSQRQVICLVTLQLFKLFCSSVLVMICRKRLWISLFSVNLKYSKFFTLVFIQRSLSSHITVSCGIKFDTIFKIVFFKKRNPFLYIGVTKCSLPIKLMNCFSNRFSVLLSVMSYFPFVRWGK